MRKYEARVNRGMELLDQVFYRRWLDWIDLDRLDMAKGDIAKPGECGCIGAQVALRSTRVRRANEGIEHGYTAFAEELGTLGFWAECGLGFDGQVQEFPGLTREWKRQIQERREAI